MVDGTRPQCRECGEYYAPSNIQDTKQGVRICRWCYMEQCEHQSTSKLPQSGKRFCNGCGKIVDKQTGQVTLEAITND